MRRGWSLHPWSNMKLHRSARTTQHGDPRVSYDSITRYEDINRFLMILGPNELNQLGLPECLPMSWAIVSRWYRPRLRVQYLLTICYTKARYPHCTLPVGCQPWDICGNDLCGGDVSEFSSRQKNGVGWTRVVSSTYHQIFGSIGFLLLSYALQIGDSLSQQLVGFRETNSLWLWMGACN